jgi:exodeoxyribonuclease V alpha subunit
MEQNMMNGDDCQQRLAGVVRKIIYRSEDSLFTVAVLSTSAGAITVCGCFYVLLPGDEVVLFGTPAVHPRYGEQFQTERYEKDFSPHYTNHAAGPLHWQTVEDALIRLQKLGLTMPEALRAYAACGEETEAVLGDNPYQLTAAPVSIPFLTADRVASALGIPCESEYRLQAALLQVLEDALAAGHTCQPLEQVLAKAGLLLTRFQSAGLESPDTLMVEIDKMLESGRIRQDEDDFLFLPSVYAAESEAAADVQRLQDTWDGPLLPDIRAALTRGEARMGLHLASAQRTVLAKVLSEPVSIITGGPGTGKTTILRVLLEALDGQVPEGSILLAAPTGRAAKRLTELTGRDAQTIHRLLGARGSEDPAVYDHHRDQPLSGRLLIVDEVSMVDVHLFSSLLAAVPDGMGLILVGDVNQLPSVGPGLVLGDLIRSGKIPAAELSTVFRQEEASAIVLNAHRIQQGLQPVLHRQEGEFLFLPREDPADIIVALEEQLERLLIQGYNVDDVQILCPFHRGDTGTTALNRRIRDRVNPWEDGVPEVRSTYELFRRGDKVMQMRNDYSKGVFNGNIGHIFHVEDGPEPVLEVEFEDRSVHYAGEELADLSLAYAITVHKAQGSEFPVIIMPVCWSLRAPVTRNLIYTAVTRARQLVVLIGRKQDLLWGIRNQRSGQRSTRLAAFLGND